MSKKLHAAIEPELAYLILLTRAGLKPLSRWEKDPSPYVSDAVARYGLHGAVVERVLVDGRPVRELLFGRSRRCVELYEARFGGRRIESGPDSMRMEGLLFGYPSCCVESFIRHGYVPNRLDPADQRILFHWACPGCRLTPALLPRYRALWRACRAQGPGATPACWESGEDPATRMASLRRVAATAAGMAALASVPAGIASGAVVDPHWIALEPWADPDADLLKTEEEALLAMDPAVADENLNGVADGADLATALAAAIELLPQGQTPGRPYRIDHMTFGLERCKVCGADVNMGLMEIVDPRAALTIDIPFIAQHFMTHGSFSYAGSVHEGRLNPVLLHAVLLEEGLSHFTPQPAGTDADSDGVRDREEPVFGLDPAAADSDGDQEPDGLELGRTLLEQVRSLPFAPRVDGPYVIDHPMDGIETCPRCGDRVVMDVWDVINPLTGGSISIPSMALHYLSHGAFSWEGGQLHGGRGRVDPLHLRAVLEGDGDGHQLPVAPDIDGDLLDDDEERQLRTDAVDPDEDHNGVLDGVDLAHALAKEINLLPVGPVPGAVYRRDFLLRGLERCAICGTTVNMGHLTVCNPLAQLYVPVPFITLHFMEHGGFSYAGDVHGESRIDPVLLRDALRSAGPPHLVAEAGDGDKDGLNDDEEPFFGTDPLLADSNNDGVPDGFELARAMWEEIGLLPREPGDGVHVIEHPLRGVVSCPVCGLLVNMGWIEIVNPRDDLTMTVSYLALHFMEHGSFARKTGTPVNPRQLELVLRGPGASHVVPVAGDSDNDGLTDFEERQLGTDPQDADSDDDGRADGFQSAQDWRRRIEALPVGEDPFGPYQIVHPANGIVPCPICGQGFDVGFVEVVDPSSDERLRVPFLNLHFLAMGSLAVPGGERLDPVLLEAMFRPWVFIAAAEGSARVEWRGEPGRHYQIMTAPDPAGPWTPGPTYAGAGAMLSYSDPAAAPGACYRIMSW